MESPGAGVMDAGDAPETEQRPDGRGGGGGGRLWEWPVRPQLGKTLPARPIGSSQVWESESLTHWGTCQGTLGRLLHFAGPLSSHL